MVELVRGVQESGDAEGGDEHAETRWGCGRRRAVAIRVVLDQKLEQIRTPVVFEIEADRIATAQGGELRFSQDRTGAQRLIERGLRAQLELQSFVTGQVAINTDFFPDTPIKLVGKSERYLEAPTIPSAMSALGRGLQEINTAELAKNVQDIVQRMARLVNGPELARQPGAPRRVGGAEDAKA